MTSTSRARLFNGNRLALRVRLDVRGRPRSGALLRKSDLAEIAHVTFQGARPVWSDGPRRRPQHLAEDIGQLLARATTAARDRKTVNRSVAEYRRHVDALLRQLRVDRESLDGYRLPLCVEPPVLDFAGLDLYGRPLWLDHDTAFAWRRMQAAADAGNIDLRAVSGYRSADYQARLVARKLAGGQPIERILRVSALPGFSEHHLGTTLDLHDGNGPPLEEAFAQTPAFAWLDANARRFGFVLSYPRDNPWGIAYEPWHWRFMGLPLA